MYRAPKVGYDRVAFTVDDTRIVATVIARNDDGTLVVSNDHFDNVWHVPVDDVEIVDEAENHPLRE